MYRSLAKKGPWAVYLALGSNGGGGGGQLSKTHWVYKAVQEAQDIMD